MAMTIHVDIVSVEGLIFSGKAEMVFAPALMGEVGIAPQHAPLLSPLKAGFIQIKLNAEEEEFYYVSGGILEVQPSIVTILADTVTRAKDLDEAKVLEAKQRAKEIPSDSDRVEGTDFAAAEAILIESEAKSQLITKLRNKK